MKVISFNGFSVVNGLIAISFVDVSIETSEKVLARIN
jgi:hypothetical protein